MKNSDDLEKKVRQSMEEYTPAAPMYLFQEIDQKRGFWMRLPNYLKYRNNWKAGGLMLGTLALLLMGGVAVSKSYMANTNATNQSAISQEGTTGDSQIDISIQNRAAQAQAAATKVITENEVAQSTIANSETIQAQLPNTNDQVITKQAVAQKETVISNSRILQKKAISKTIANRSAAAADMSTANIAFSNTQKTLPNELIVANGVAQNSLVVNATQTQARESISVLGLLANRQNLERFVGLSEMDAAQFMPRLKCPEPEDGGRFIYYVDALVSPDYAITEITGRTTAFDYYAAERRATEEFNYAFSAGVRVSAVTKAGLALRTGIIYSQINEKFDHVGDSEEISGIVITEDGQGNVISIDTGYFQITTQTNNTFKLLDIPVIVGYETYMLRNRLVLTFNGGAYFNISSTPAGQILDANLEPKSVDPDFKGSLKPFKNNFGVSVYGSLGVGYRFNEKLAFLVEPHFRYFVKPITVDSYELKQGYITTGLTTGLRMQF